MAEGSGSSSLGHHEMGRPGPWRWWPGGECHGHRVIAFSPLELNSARELNRRLYDYLRRIAL